LQSAKKAASEFLANRRVAVTGVSRTPKTHGSNTVYRRLRDRGYDVFAVNPHADTVEGDPAYQHVKSIPGGVDAVVIGTRPELAEGAMRECAELGIKPVWMHRGPGAGGGREAGAAAARPRRRQRLGRRHRLRPAARHHRDRWRLSPVVRARVGFWAQDHAPGVRRAHAQAGVSRRAPDPVRDARERSRR